MSRSRVAHAALRSKQLRKAALDSASDSRSATKAFERFGHLGQRIAQRRGRGDPRRSAFGPHGRDAQRDDRAAERAQRRIDPRQCAGRARACERIARQRLELARADRPAEELLRDIGQLVSFVDDHGVRSRQQLAEPQVFQREIREQQVMIDDHDLCGLRAAPRLGDETALDELALPAEAVVDGRCHLGAQRMILGEILELREVAGIARLPPRVERLERRDRRRIARTVAPRRVEPVPAQVIAAAFEHGDPHRPADDGAEQRQVATEQLVLQRVRAGRDDRAPFEQQQGQQIGEGLADTGARLDDRMPARLERSDDELRHLLLCGPIGETRQALGERAVGAEHVVEIHRGTARNRAIPVAPTSSGPFNTQRTWV